MVNKSAQQQNPDILDEQTSFNEIVLNNKLQKNK